MHHFTAADIINALRNWNLEPLTLEEKSYLMDQLISNKKDDFQYAMNDIESLILELISED